MLVTKLTRIVKNKVDKLSDEGCMNVWGKYKLTWYGNDSHDFKVINDSCEGREQSVDGVTAKRISSK